MIVTISDGSLVCCGETLCDPLALYDIGQECGNCPILKFAEKYEAVKYDGYKK